MRVVQLSMMAGVLVLAAACGGGSPAGATRGPTSGAPTAAAACTGSGGTAVQAVDFAFNPAAATVAVGGTVTWTNAGAAAHTVTFTGGPDCGRINAGASVSRTFDAAGTFAYVCTFHPATMSGAVVVQ